MPGMMGGTHAHLPIDEEFKIDVERALRGEDEVRAFKVIVQGEKLVNGGQVDMTDDVEADFKTLADSLDDNKPCIALVALKGSQRFEESDWAMILYTPSGGSVKDRMMNASSKKPLEGAFKEIKFEPYEVSEKSEVTLNKFLDATRPMTEEDRLKCMSQEERDHEKVKKEIAKEQGAAPKMLAGLAALEIKVKDEFKEAMATMFAEEGKAVLGKLCGDNNESLSGEIIDAATPTALKGKLPKDEACYVIVRKEKHFVVITWLPEDCHVKKRMKCATFKKSLTDILKREYPEEVATTAGAECTEDDDLTDDVLEQKSSGGYSGDAASGASAKPGGFKPPFGGMAMPGMGGGRPPPGAVAMPGMGPR